ncbi:unnamed protein product [Rotaria sordida]|uniref:JmjC domain-containing protein n=3 Tax=Rotaria sordida TaxID=392033 RepID=A0A815AZK6_9BILA|nr:unnamed protein product [Rotaria sordida]CAF3737203.1 unnamed protein product [Rotaria sordida]
MQMSPISENNNPNHSNKMFVSSSNSIENNCKTNSNMNLTTSRKIPTLSTNDCIPNISSSTSTAISNRKRKSIVQPNSSIDQCNSQDLSNNQHHLSTSHENNNDYISNYKLSNFIIRIEQIPNLWMIDTTNGRLNKDDNDNKKSSSRINKQIDTSPILHGLLTSSSKSVETDLLSSIESTRYNINENRNNKSPQYRPRHSYCYSSETKFRSKDNLNKTSKMSRQVCRSPIFTRRPQQQIQKRIDNDFDRIHQPTALLSLYTNESTLLVNNNMDNQLFNENQTIISLPSSSKRTDNNKRPFESSSSEQILIKRRCQKIIPMIITQNQLCISYPKDISRCVDCRTINSSNLSTKLSSCRFQHCRTLKYLGDDKYEVEGFTTVDKAKSQDTKYLPTPNSGGQPPLSLINANYIFTQIAKVFCSMFLHEETERLRHNEKTIIRKQYMAGWREFCDQCSTTLFNCHYMCKECGYMLCIECSNELSQINTEKRKKFKRICTHVNTHCLSEFIPWNILIKLHNDCINYLTKLKIDHSMKFYPSSRTENLSMFIKALKTKRLHDIRDVPKIWSSINCNHDPNIEFYCNGRLPVFNEWISENAKRFFRKVWKASCPVLVKRVHHNLSKTLWHPKSFKLHMIDHHETPSLWDCETLKPIETNEEILIRFWEGFERLHVRLRDKEHGGRRRILKLKDWPTKKDFASVFPSRINDLMKNIPFSDYTRRSYVYNGVTYRGGIYNIVERLPACLVKPDLGPKLYIAYSQLTSKEAKQAGTTNLHIDVSDAVNVLVYVGIGGHGDDGSDKEEEIRQVEAEILDSNIDEAQLQRLRNGEKPGALWHLFRSDDVKKIRDYIGRTQRKTTGSDSIHDQTTYLEREDLEKLKDCSNVEAYPILQFLGDAVFIPSGAPHQVKNLHSCIKIAEDFVSPENLDRCLITTNEFRSLSKTHTNHADILQAKNILYYTIRDAVNSLT